MPTVTPWQPTLSDFWQNLARPWVLVRDNCGHVEHFHEKSNKRFVVKRFATANQAQIFANKLNSSIEVCNEQSIITNNETFD